MPLKRKADASGVDADRIDAATQNVARDVTSYDELFEIVQQVRSIALVLKAQKIGDEEKIKVIQASKLKDMDEVSTRTGLIYQYGMPAHNWTLVSSKLREELIFGCNWLETALSQFRASTFWKATSCEALIRTGVDLVLFDRMMLVHDQDAARNLLLVGEQHIETQCLDGNTIISGTADYILGYPYSNGEEIGLESMYIAIEAKKSATISKAVHQLAAYLVGMQQHRKAANKIVHVVYGIATDSNAYRFLRLDESMSLQVSREFQIGIEEDKHYVYYFIDAILAAAIQCSPHTTPMKTFPDHSSKWTHKVEKKLFIIPEDLKAKLPADWEDWILFYNEDEEDDDRGNDFEILRSKSPTKSNTTLRPKPKGTEQNQAA